jgi:hypothetical protein
MVAEQFDLAKAKFRFLLFLLQTDVGNEFGLSAEANGNALHALGMAEVGRKKIEPYSQGTFRRAVVDWSPSDNEAIKRERLDVYLGPALYLASSNLAWVHEFNGLKTATTLMRFVRSNTMRDAVAVARPQRKSV